MSYIRYGHPLVYVEGNSEDYIFGHTQDKDGKWLFTDYGGISDTGFIELLFENWETEDNDFKEHLLRRLAGRLNVKLRPKPLTDEELEALEEKNMEEYMKEEAKLNTQNQNKKNEVSKNEYGN